MDSDETLLLTRLRAGEQAAFEELVRRYGGQLLAVAQRFLRNEDDARDAVQDSFLSAFRALRSIRGEGPPVNLAAPDYRQCSADEDPQPSAQTRGFDRLDRVD